MNLICYYLDENIDLPRGPQSDKEGAYLGVGMWVFFFEELQIVFAGSYLSADDLILEVLQRRAPGLQEQELQLSPKLPGKLHELLCRLFAELFRHEHIDVHIVLTVVTFHYPPEFIQERLKHSPEEAVLVLEVVVYIAHGYSRFASDGSERSISETIDHKFLSCSSQDSGTSIHLVFCPRQFDLIIGT